MKKVPIFNMGDPVRRQCALREDGIWFIRVKRDNKPGYSAWKIAPFNARPIQTWYSGKTARLPHE